MNVPSAAFAGSGLCQIGDGTVTVAEKVRTIKTISCATRLRVKAPYARENTGFMTKAVTGHCD